MAEELLEHRAGSAATSAPISAASSTWIGIARLRDHDLGLEAIVVVDADDLLDQVHPDRAGVVERPDGRARRS